MLEFIKSVNKVLHVSLPGKIMMQLCLLLTPPLKANNKLMGTFLGTVMLEVQHTKAGTVTLLTHLKCSALIKFPAWKLAGLEPYKD